MDKKSWNSHFLHIVTETVWCGKMQNDVFISEKTLKPIVGHKPFVILAGPNHYRLLHDLGFDTFDDIFGNGYDTDNLNKTINWIIDLIKFLNKENKVALYKKLAPRIKENYNIFLSEAQKNRKKREAICR